MKRQGACSLILALISALAAAGCNRGKEPLIQETANGIAQLERGALPAHHVLLEYKGGAVTAGDVQAEVAPALARAQAEIKHAYQQAARKVLGKRLLAEKAKKSGLADPAALIAKEMEKYPISYQQVADYIQLNRLTGKNIDKDKIKNYLKNELLAGKEAEMGHRLSVEAQAKEFP